MLMEQRELAKIAWQKELDKKLELYFGKNVFLSLREGRVKSVMDLMLTLSEAELDAVIPQLRQACLDVEAIIKNGDSPANPCYVLGYKYPKHFAVGGGKNSNRRYVLIQILI